MIIHGTVAARPPVVSALALSTTRATLVSNVVNVVLDSVVASATALSHCPPSSSFPDLGVHVDVRLPDDLEVPAEPGDAVLDHRRRRLPGLLEGGAAAAGDQGQALVGLGVVALDPRGRGVADVGEGAVPDVADGHRSPAEGDQTDDQRDRADAGGDHQADVEPSLEAPGETDLDPDQQTEHGQSDHGEQDRDPGVHLALGPVGVGRDQIVQDGHRVGPQTAAGVAEVLGADGEALAVVGPRQLDVLGVVDQLDVERGERVPVARFRIGGLGDQLRGLCDRVVVRLALVRLLETADQERVGGVGVGPQQVGLDLLDTDQLGGRRLGPLQRGRQQQEGRQPPDPEDQPGGDHQGGQPAQLPGRVVRLRLRRCRRLDRQRRRRRGRGVLSRGGGDRCWCRRGGPGGLRHGISSLSSGSGGLGSVVSGLAGLARLGGCERIVVDGSTGSPSSRSSGSSSRSCAIVGSATSRRRQACRPMAPSSRLRAYRPLPNVGPRGWPPTRWRNGSRSLPARRSRHSRRDVGRWPAARRRRSRRTRWWSGTGWPDRGSGR